MLNTSASLSGLIDQLFQILGSKISQWFLLKPTPKIFHGVQFWGIWWEKTRMNPGCFVKKLTDLFSSMRQESIPDDKCMGFKLSVQLVEESPYTRGIEVTARKKAKVKPYTVSFWRDTQRRYCRNFLVRASSLRQDRCISFGSPSSTNDGGHKQTTFVYEDNKGFEPRCFFLMRGHSSFIQRLISFLSRSLAIRWGFCGVQPRECRSLLT